MAYEIDAFGNSFNKVSSNTQNPNGYAPVADLKQQSGSSTPPTSGEATQVNSTDTAKKAQAVLEYNTLKGDLTLRLCTMALKVKANSTITLSGVGKYLSGQYFVEGVQYTLPADGPFEIVCSLIKTGFGDNLKSDTPIVATEQRSEPVQVKASSSVSSKSSSSTQYSNPNSGKPVYMEGRSTSVNTSVRKTIEAGEVVHKDRTQNIKFGSSSNLDVVSSTKTSRGGSFGGKGFGSSK